MPAMEPLCRLAGINPHNLSKKENLILEGYLFLNLYEQLKNEFKNRHQPFFSSLMLNKEMENTMLEANFLRMLINDILVSETYTLTGIALYTNTDQEVLEDIIVGKNQYPSAIFIRKIIELHRTVRQDLYQAIFQKLPLSN